MRKLWMAAAASAAMMATVGCKPTAGDVARQREDLAKSEARAREDIAHIREEAAKDKAEIEAEGRKDVAEERQEMASELQRRDEKTQRDVAAREREVADKREDLAETRHDAVAADRREVVDGVAMKDRPMSKDGTAKATDVVRGTLESTVGSQLTVRDADGRKLELETDDDTIVTRNGLRVDIDDYKEGTEVRASYLYAGDDERVARKVEILSLTPKR